MKNIFYIIFSIFIFNLSCKKDEPVKVDPITKPKPKYQPIEQTFPIKYRAKLEEGKLPYPHHNPESWQQIDYENSISNLFIMNNFGLYQWGDTKESLYFHDGLDIVLKNGTPIFAVDAGIVRSINSGSEFYRTVIVEDTTLSGYGWAYTHVNFFDVKPGDTIQQGQYIGRVNFKGIEHIHLSRFKFKKPGVWKDVSDFIKIFPNDFFILNDDVPPIIKKPFHYFINNSDEFFENEGIDTVSGKVDIVVSMRDSSAYSGSSRLWGDRFGDRLAVKKIDYRILKDGQEVKSFHSFDFGKIGLAYYPQVWQDLLLVYKRREVLDEIPLSYHAFFSHYIITNANAKGQELFLNKADKVNAWDTQEIDDNGAFLYPNGLYEVEVTAWDGALNMTIESDKVWVEN